MRTGKTSNRPNLRSWHVGAMGNRVRLGRMRLAGLGLALLLTIAPTGVAAAQPPEQAPGPPGSIGVVRVLQHQRAHRRLPDAVSVRPALPAELRGGLSFEMWGDPATKDFAAAWQKYDSARPANGYASAWVQMCIRANDDHDPNALLSEVVSQISGTPDPDIPIYVSPINAYQEGHVCGRIGPDGFAVGEAAIDWGVANLGVVARTGHRAADGRHAGRRRLPSRPVGDHAGRRPARRLVRRRDRSRAPAGNRPARQLPPPAVHLGRPAGVGRRHRSDPALAHRETNPGHRPRRRRAIGPYQAGRRPMSCTVLVHYFVEVPIACDEVVPRLADARGAPRRVGAGRLPAW